VSQTIISTSCQQPVVVFILVPCYQPSRKIFGKLESTIICTVKWQIPAVTLQNAFQLAITVHDRPDDDESTICVESSWTIFNFSSTHTEFYDWRCE
jgi:hypothetical protein